LTPRKAKRANGKIGEASDIPYDEYARSVGIFTDCEVV